MNWARARGRTTLPALAVAAPVPLLVMTCPPGSAPGGGGRCALRGTLLRDLVGQSGRAEDPAQDRAGRRGHPRAADDGRDGDQDRLRLLRRQARLLGDA